MDKFQIIFCDCSVMFMPETLPTADNCQICGGGFKSGALNQIPPPVQPFSYGPMGFYIHNPLPRPPVED